MYSRDRVARPTERVSCLSVSQSSRPGRTIYSQCRTCRRRHLCKGPASLPGYFSVGQPRHRAAICLYTYGDISQSKQTVEDPAAVDSTDIKDDDDTFTTNDKSLKKSYRP